MQKNHLVFVTVLFTAAICFVIFNPGLIDSRVPRRTSHLLHIFEKETPSRAYQKSSGDRDHDKQENENKRPEHAKEDQNEAHILNEISRYNSEVENETLNMQQFAMDDPRLIAEIRRRYLIPPPPKNTPYFLSNPDINADPSQGQGKFVREYFKNKRDGFFVELGGLDGEFFSNTMIMERKLGWKGLLIEADPTNLKKLLSRQRHVWVLPACCSVTPNPTWTNFRSQQGAGLTVAGGSRLIKAHEIATDIEVQCVPFYSVLLAINRTTIDFFSLDIEGAELGLLRTIPWDKVDIKSFAIEFHLDPEGKEGIVKYLTERGYKVLTEEGAEWMNHDVILVKD